VVALLLIVKVVWWSRASPGHQPGGQIVEFIFQHWKHLVKALIKELMYLKKIDRIGGRLTKRKRAVHSVNKQREVT